MWKVQQTPANLPEEQRMAKLKWRTTIADAVFDDICRENMQRESSGQDSTRTKVMSVTTVLGVVNCTVIDFTLF